MRILATVYAAATALAFSSTDVWAAELSAPSGPVLLTVSGDIAHTNLDGTAQFDRAMLADLGTTEFETTTIWTEGTQTFTGILLRDLLDRLEVREGTIKATAINDYSVDIPVADIQETEALLAMSRNNQPMSVRDKGPLWIVYPYDSDSLYRSELYYARSIWQLDRIEVLR